VKKKLLKQFCLAVLIIFTAFGLWRFAQAASYASFRVSITPGPQCYDGQDNDGDGQTDYPDDSDCDSPSDDDEGIPPSGGGGGGGGGGGPIIIPVTSAVFSGYAYPLNQVTLLKDGQIALQTIAGPDAKFNISLAGLSSGNYSFSLYSQDVYGNRSAAFTISIFITQGASTNISGIFIAPTGKVGKSQVQQGDNLAIFGQSVPGGEVSIVVNSSYEHLAKVQAGSDGIYLYNFDTTPLEIGDHTAKTKAAYQGGLSSFSKLASFKVMGPDEELEPENEPKAGDINNDKRVNLVDFSIMAYWYKKSEPPQEADLNGDGKVSLVDFSILAYHWTG